jgi:hypothetical protein
MRTTKIEDTRIVWYSHASAVAERSTCANVTMTSACRRLVIFLCRPSGGLCFIDYYAEPPIQEVALVLADFYMSPLMVRSYFYDEGFAAAKLVISQGS